MAEIIGINGKKPQQADEPKLDVVDEVVKSVREALPEIKGAILFVFGHNDDMVTRISHVGPEQMALAAIRLPVIVNRLLDGE